MFIEALFMIVKTWKQPRHLLVGEWVNKLVHLHNEYSTLKRNELSSQIRHGVNLTAYCKVNEVNLKSQF